MYIYQQKKYIYIQLDNRIYSYKIIHSCTYSFTNVNLILICIELPEM